ncbi:MAG TPA: hypothetical protein PLG90_11440 [Ignavibacteria bacterium]|nr:hypothetical protein [Ignavibacteria bacterium]
MNPEINNSTSQTPQEENLNDKNIQIPNPENKHLKSPKKRKPRRKKYFIKYENQPTDEFNSEKEYFNELAEKLIAHLKSGYSPESFPFEDFSVIENYFYLKENGVENNPGSTIFRIKQAHRASRKKWEKFALEHIDRESNFFPASLWIFCMKNLFDWVNTPVKNSDENFIPPPRQIRLDGNGWSENETE